jgi:acyl-CoA thioesterase-2
MHRAGLTYLSDLGSGFGQQKAIIGRGGPSIDHSVWFQHGIRADDWVLVDLRPIKAWGGRGAYHGSLRDRSGALGATLYQEHLLLPGTLADAPVGERKALEAMQAHDDELRTSGRG